MLSCVILCYRVLSRVIVCYRAGQEPTITRITPKTCYPVLSWCYLVLSWLHHVILCYRVLSCVIACYRVLSCTVHVLSWAVLCRSCPAVSGSSAFSAAHPLHETYIFPKFVAQDKSVPLFDGWPRVCAYGAPQGRHRQRAAHVDRVHGTRRKDARCAQHGSRHG